MDLVLVCIIIGALAGCYAGWRKGNEDSRYYAALRAKERRGETLEPWEYEAIHPKPTAGLSFSDIALGLVFWKIFFGNDSNEKRRLPP